MITNASDGTAVYHLSLEALNNTTVDYMQSHKYSVTRKNSSGDIQPAKEYVRTHTSSETGRNFRPSQTELQAGYIYTYARNQNFHFFDFSRHLGLDLSTLTPPTHTHTHMCALDTERHSRCRADNPWGRRGCAWTPQSRTSAEPCQLWTGGSDPENPFGASKARIWTEPGKYQENVME